jgi:hypothetical protein
MIESSVVTVWEASRDALARFLGVWREFGVTPEFLELQIKRRNICDTYQSDFGARELRLVGLHRGVVGRTSSTIWGKRYLSQTGNPEPASLNKRSEKADQKG